MPPRSTPTTQSSDPQSGLSWHEHVIPATKSRSKNLLTRTLGLPPLLRAAATHTGAATLQDMALRCLLHHLDMLEAESLVGLPVRILERVWGGVRGSNLASLHLWHLFTTANPTTPPTLLHRTTTTSYPPLSTLLPSISSTAYLTSLNLISPPSSLLPLAQLYNLVALTVIGGVVVIDDEIRHWGKCARFGDGFTRLRVLVLRGLRGVTEEMLSHVGEFKRLEVVVTSRCGVDVRQAKGRGWELTTDHFFASTSNSLQPPDFLSAVDEFIVARARTFTADAADTVTHDDNGDPPPQKPLLMLQLGRPSSSHLLRAEEIECWVRDKNQRAETEGRKKRNGETEAEEKRHDGKEKKRRIREGKGKEFLGLLGGDVE